MIPADLVRALLIAVIPLAWLAGVLSLPLLVGVAFLTGVAGIFFEISGFAYVPSLVPYRDLTAANRAVQGSNTVTEVAGPGLAGLLVQVVGPPLAMVADALSYVASSVGVLMGRAPTRPNEAAAEPEAEEESERTGFAEGFRQTVIPGSLLARSGSAYRQVMYGSIPIGSALAGVIGELAGTRAGVMIGAVGLALSALPMFTRRIRALREPATGAEA